MSTSILLIGFDERDKAQIWEINDNAGVGSHNFRRINFHSIGSGSGQATNILLHSKHSKSSSLNQTIYQVYKAKKYAEASRGVGKETDILILSLRGVTELDKEQKKILKEVYKNEINYSKSNAELNKLRPLKN